MRFGGYKFIKASTDLVFVLKPGYYSSWLMMHCWGWGRRGRTTQRCVFTRSHPIGENLVIFHPGNSKNHLNFRMNYEFVNFLNHLQNEMEIENNILNAYWCFTIKNCRSFKPRLTTTVWAQDKSKSSKPSKAQISCYQPGVRAVAFILGLQLLQLA